MEELIEFAYIFKRNIDNKNKYTTFYVIDLIKGIYNDKDNTFISEDGINYQHVLFSEDVGFALRRHIEENFYEDYYNKMFKYNYDLMNYNYFYFEKINNEIKLIWNLDKDNKICNDIDLDKYNKQDIEFNNDIVIKNNKNRKRIKRFNP